MSVRIRLTLLYSGVLAFTLFLFAILLYVNMSKALYHEVDQGIENMSMSVLKSIKISYPLKEIILPNVDVFSSSDIYLQIVDMDGRLVSHSSNLGMQLLPLSESTLRTALEQKSFYETVRSDGQTLRVFNQPLVLSGNVVGLLQVGRTLHQVDLTLSRLKLFLLTMGALAVMIAGLLGFSLAKVVFRPLEKIVETTAAIQKGSDLGRRVAYTGPTKDELGLLVHTINGMLERLEQVYQQLEATSEVQKRFIADASHELRTPLTTIRGNAEFLLRLGEDKSSEEKDALKDIVGESQRLTRLVSGLLSLAKADAGQKPVFEVIHVLDVVDEVSRNARIMQDQVSFVYQCLDKQDDLWVYGNGDLIKQMLYILLDNAFKYTPPGGRVTLFVEKATLALTPCGVIAVEDTGAGISEGEKNNIFLRFYRGDEARGSSGSGLGLAIAQQIIQQHGGEIQVEEGKHGGSIFRVFLPLVNLEESGGEKKN